MTAIFLPSTRASSVTAGTRYDPIGTSSSPSATTESFAQTTWRDGGVFSNMYITSAQNAATTDGTMTYRVGGADGNQTVTIPAATTGEFTDSTNTDTVSAGHLINYKLVSGATDATFYNAQGIRFAPTTSTDTINKYSGHGNITDTSVGVTFYNQLSGALSVAANAQTETNAQFKYKISATLQNLQINVNANTLSVATVKSRINAADGNLSVTIGSGVTGFLEDTANTDAVVSGDLVCTALNSTVTTTFNIRSIAVSSLTTTNKTHYFTGASALGVLSQNKTYWLPLTGFLQALDSASSTEPFRQISTGLEWVASNLECYISANANTGTSVFTLRKNAANGNQTISVTTTATGYFEDTTNTDSIATTDKINYQALIPNSGTTITLANIGIIADYTAIVVVGGFDEYYSRFIGRIGNGAGAC